MIPNDIMVDRETFHNDRPSSEQLSDLHVYSVPPELWREHLHSAANQIISEAVSAGFIRVAPEMNINSLREEVENQLGFEIVPREYVFLKSVGRCLTRVRPKQEYQMKVKSFLPPQAYAPEIFVLEATAEVRNVPYSGASSQSSNVYTANSDRSEFSGFRPIPPIKTNTIAVQTGEDDPFLNAKQRAQSPYGQPCSPTYSRAAGVVHARDSHPVSSRPVSARRLPDGFATLPARSRGTSPPFHHSSNSGSETTPHVGGLSDPAKNLPEGRSHDQEVSDPTGYDPPLAPLSASPAHVGRNPPGTQADERASRPEHGGEEYLPPLSASPSSSPDGNSPRGTNMAAHSLDQRGNHGYSQNGAPADSAFSDGPGNGPRGAGEQHQDELRSPRRVAFTKSSSRKGSRAPSQNSGAAILHHPKARRKREEEERQRRAQEEEEMERRRKQEAEGELRKREEEKRLWEEEQRRRQQDEEQERRQREDEASRSAEEEEERRRHEEEAKRQDDEKHRQDNERQQEEERRRQEEENQRQDERHRQEDNARRREDERKRQEEEQRKRQEEEEEEERLRNQKRTPSPSPFDEAAGRSEGVEALRQELARSKAERQAAERQREELVKRAKQLQNRSQQRRNQARDLWKKRYFEEKKKTPPLEDQCSKMRQELESLHRRIMSQLESNKDQAGTKRTGDKPSQQSNLKIQATKLQHDIEELQRRVENVKMKLTTEMKLRNQAETELRALRAEMTQKKISSSLHKGGGSTAVNPAAQSQDFHTRQQAALTQR